MVKAGSRGPAASGAVGGSPMVTLPLGTGLTGTPGPARKPALKNLGGPDQSRPGGKRPSLPLFEALMQPAGKGGGDPVPGLPVMVIGAECLLGSVPAMNSSRRTWGQSGPGVRPGEGTHRGGRSPPAGLIKGCGGLPRNSAAARSATMGAAAAAPLKFMVGGRRNCPPRPPGCIPGCSPRPRVPVVGTGAGLDGQVVGRVHGAWRPRRCGSGPWGRPGCR